jgi:hypothetical protein
VAALVQDPFGAHPVANDDVDGVQWVAINSLRAMPGLVKSGAALAEEAAARFHIPQQR